MDRLSPDAKPRKFSFRSTIRRVTLGGRQCDLRAQLAARHGNVPPQGPPPQLSPLTPGAPRPGCRRDRDDAAREPSAPEDRLRHFKISPATRPIPGPILWSTFDWTGDAASPIGGQSAKYSPARNVGTLSFRLTSQALMPTHVGCCSLKTIAGFRARLILETRSATGRYVIEAPLAAAGLLVRSLSPRSGRPPISATIGSRATTRPRFHRRRHAGGVAVFKAN